VRALLLAALVPAAVIATAGTAVAAPPRVSTVDLGDLGGGQTFPGDLTERGWIAGSSRTATGDPHAVVWRNGELTDLGVEPDGTFSLAAGITERGQVAGYGDTATGSKAFFWERGRRTDLGSLGGDQVVATAINERGQVIGTSTTATGERHGFLWQRGRLTDLGDLVPAAITDAGVVYGVAGTHVVRWRAGRVVDLGQVGDREPYSVLVNERGDLAAYGSLDNHYQAYVRTGGAWRPLPALGTGDATLLTSLSETGVLVGSSNTTPGGLQQAAVWRHGKVGALPGLGGETSGAYDTNSAGDVVGYAQATDGVTHAVLWRRGKLVDLGVAGAQSVATRISERGQILGTADTQDERIRGLRWTVSGA
jgi:probable HAF family extracellular repeat protein